jgi:hypothetical protein
LAKTSGSQKKRWKTNKTPAEKLYFYRALEDSFSNAYLIFINRMDKMRFGWLASFRHSRLKIDQLVRAVIGVTVRTFFDSFEFVLN